MGTASATHRRKVTGSVNHRQTLVDALRDEDRILRERLAQTPRRLREIRGPDGALSFKETLGHIAFWDNFTVEFFTTKLDVCSCDPSPPVDFEERSRQALAHLDGLPFGEVLVRYLESTGALLDFLRENWGRLTPREQHDFWVPVQHRRHHRITLFRSLDAMLAAGAGAGAGAEAATGALAEAVAENRALAAGA